MLKLKQDSVKTKEGQVTCNCVLTEQGSVVTRSRGVL